MTRAILNTESSTESNFDSLHKYTESRDIEGFIRFFNGLDSDQKSDLINFTDQERSIFLYIAINCQFSEVKKILMSVSDNLSSEQIKEIYCNFLIDYINSRKIDSFLDFFDFLNDQQKLDLIDFRDRRDMTIFHYLANSNEIIEIKEILELILNGLSKEQIEEIINCQNGQRMSVFDVALSEDHFLFIKIMLEKLDNQEREPYLSKIQQKNLGDVIKMLMYDEVLDIETYFDQVLEDDFCTNYLTGQSNIIEIATKLQAIKSITFFGNKFGNQIKEYLSESCKQHQLNPLHFATLYGNIEMINFFIANSADINSKSDYDETPLYIASLFDHYEVAILLIGEGCDVNIADEDGRSPLFIALQKEYRDIAKLLIKSEADLDNVIAKIIDYSNKSDEINYQGKPDLESLIPLFVDSCIDSLSHEKLVSFVEKIAKEEIFLNQLKEVHLLALLVLVNINSDETFQSPIQLSEDSLICMQNILKERIPDDEERSLKMSYFESIRNAVLSLRVENSESEYKDENCRNLSILKLFKDVDLSDINGIRQLHESRPSGSSIQPIEKQEFFEGRRLYHF